MGSSQGNDYAHPYPMFLLCQEEGLSALAAHCADAGHPIQLYGEGCYYHCSSICPSLASLCRENPHESYTGPRRYRRSRSRILYDLYGDTTPGKRWRGKHEPGGIYCPPLRPLFH